ncbi:hypothetical protein [Halomonas sp. KO116]|uniref:hypothetical protein n=1 Tax=Halomonas sp. KO116 TaxID=1504981 RepID=UPI0004E40167|nr:hypothetical protein [Halomonas sp. KO116]AJY51507.1 hypothetical protein KO116_03034 [Halomonas sp. KO116]
MPIFYQSDEPITSAKNAIREIGCSLEELTIAFCEEKASLIVVPSTPFHIGVRFPRNYRKGIFDRAGENPLSIDIEDADGFTISPGDSEKVLRIRNWKTVTPQKIAWLTHKYRSVDLHTPYSLSLQQRLHEGECRLHCVCGIGDLRRAYQNQEFFFKNKLLLTTQIDLNNCYILQSDLELIAKNIHEKTKPNFSNIGDYQINEWSNSVIIDINAAYHHLKNTTKKINYHYLSSNDEAIKTWFRERWKGKKGVTAACLRQIPKIVKNENIEIDLDALDVLEEEIFRNQTGATDILILIDISAERRMKKVRSYLGSEKFNDELIKVGIKSAELRQAIYSIIKAK